ncbi:MAG: putative quinol monooxygenase [Pseudomonadota bacterium]
MYVVAVTFHVDAAHTDAFLAAVTENARQSLDSEPDCHRFDVAVGENGPETVFLYEIYADRAAFDAHLASAHFKSFDALVSPWVTSKEVGTFTLVGSA